MICVGKIDTTFRSWGYIKDLGIGFSHPAFRRDKMLCMFTIFHRRNEMYQYFGVWHDSVYFFWLKPVFTILYPRPEGRGNCSLIIITYTILYRTLFMICSLISIKSSSSIDNPQISFKTKSGPF